jgi:Protein of unknown function (DUF2877)
VHQQAGVAASVLTAPLIDGPTRHLHVIHASRHAWQLADEEGRVTTCVMLPGAVRLPSGIALATTCTAPSSVSVGDGAVVIADQPSRVTRWWRPARPRIAPLRGRVAVSEVRDLAREAPQLVGRGEGLTPYGDDVLCGALVACRAAEAPEAEQLVEAVRAVDLDHRTTATSALLLRLATDGWCIDEVAEYLTALAGGVDISAARARLLGVGHSSGSGLLAGIHRVIRADQGHDESEVAV